MGLAFSVQTGKKTPPSLINIYEALANDPKIKFTFNSKLFSEGNLMPWAKQGVFLLDAILTVRESEGLSHKSMGWELFTRATIMAINNLCDNIVFMLWGSKA